jgi:Pvc16 N-terminal domain
VIYDTLKFLGEEVNKYLNLKLGGSFTEPKLVLGNVSLAYDPPPGEDILAGKAILSLVNIEEDRVAKQQENYTVSDISTIYKNPPLYLNLFVMFSVNKKGSLKDYEDSLLWLGHIIQFFQHQQVFTPASHPNLNPKIQKIIADLHTLNFEQVNNLWGTLGGKYLPSVLYKVRQITIDENAIEAEGSLIKQLNTVIKGKPASI